MQMLPAKWTVLLYTLFRASKSLEIPHQTDSNESAEENGSGLSSGLPGPPLDVVVTVQLSFSPANQTKETFDAVTNKRIKLVITWLHPTGGVPPDGYNVQVHPISPDQTNCKDHFADFFHHVHFTDPPSVEIGSGTPKNEYLVQFLCSYSITVQSSPTSPLNAVIQNFSVPECVSDVCYCGSRPRLPKPHDVAIHALDDGAERSFQLTWSYARDPDALVSPYLFNVRVEKTFNLGFGSIYRKVKDYRQIYRGDHYLQMIHKLHSESNYRLQVAAEDAHHCEGNAAEVYIKKATLVDDLAAYDIYNKGILFGFGIVGIIFMFALSITVGLSWKRLSHRLRLQLHATTSRTYLYPSQSHRESRPALQFNGPSAIPTTCITYPKEIEMKEAHYRPLKIDEYEIDPSCIKLGIQIGKGAYGRVHLATADGLLGASDQSTVVAVKLMKNVSIGISDSNPNLVFCCDVKEKTDPYETDDFLAEIAMMKMVGKHENIAIMLACVTLQQPYYMVLEYVANGDLLHYLRELRNVYYKMEGTIQPSVNKYREQGSRSSEAPLLNMSNKNYPLMVQNCCYNSDLSLSSSTYVVPETSRGVQTQRTCKTLDLEEVQDFAKQIVRGMEHLEKKNITHRDLAARNVLLSENHVLKISDFGLSRHGVYVNTRNRMLPLRWLAPESITDHLYSSKSDVWAFGVVVWEIGTLGGFPYSDVPDPRLLSHLQEGHRLPKPCNASDKLYHMMLKCWDVNSDNRPSFKQLRSLLDDIEAKDGHYVDFTNLSTIKILPPMKQVQAQVHD